MEWKHAIKQFIPPIFLNAYRSLGSPYRRGFMWQGVYDHIDQVPPAGPGYKGEVWLRSRVAQYHSLADAVNQPGFVPIVPGFRFASLSLLAALIGDRPGTLRIVDFGGALGVAFPQLVSSAALPAGLEYHVVDNRESCEQGRMLFQNDPRITFHESLDRSLRDIDVVFMSGVLQYVRNYEETLQTLAALGPSYILMTYLSAGATPTFASAQTNLKGSVMPSWFFNVQSIVEIMNGLGYKVSYKAAVDPDDRIDMGNFPTDRRIGYMITLLFTAMRTRPT